ncbi:glycerophosphodiester phosphodiesterase [Bryobacter aggregatus]|uniref:glycerophosphodiester phosphodiesterase n=1 Tax=Bryobacter aggregatus TaxID=360054 RepID=UPI0004E20476|nr:glycerophosphodiester phosphodiesterase [Bryobacter aggregatus]
MKIALLLLSLLLSLEAKILVHGHRGARAARPENSIAAFEYAIAQGADFLELDLAVTKDNVLVVSHDPQLNPAICMAPAGLPLVIRESTLAQIKQWDCGSKRNPEFPQQQTIPGTRIPTFDEVLALAPKGNFGFNVETKSSASKPQLTPPPAEFARMVLDAVQKHKLESRVIIQSFDWRTLTELRKLSPTLHLSALHPTGMAEAVVKLDYVQAAKDLGIDMVSPHYRLTTKARVDEAHAAGMKVVPWTANDVKIWDQLIADGVDAIITDDPAALIAHLKAKGLR